MSALPIILAILAGFVGCFAISNLVRWNKPYGEPSEGWFGLTCLGFSAYALFQIALFGTGEVAQASNLLRWQGFFTCLLFITFINFGAAFARRPKHILEFLAMGCYASLSLWSLASPAGYWFQSVTAMNPVEVLGGRIYHPEGATAVTYYVSIALQLPLYLRWILDGRILTRGGSRIDGTLWTVAIGLALLTSAHDHLVDFGLLPPPYLAEYPFPLILLAMGMRFLLKRTQEHGELLALKTSLADSEARFRDVFENSSDAILIHDAHTGVIHDVNQTWVQMYGYPKEGCEALTIDMLSAPLPEYSADQAMAHIATARTEGQDRFAWKARHMNGTIFPVEVTLKFTRVAGEECVVANVRDLSQQEAATLALFDEQAFTNTLLDSLPGTFYLYDQHLRLKRWNRTLETQLGYSPKQLATMTLGDFYPAGPIRDALVAGVLAWFSRPNPPVMRETVVVRADGTKVPYLITATRLETRDGPLLMGVGLDVSGLVDAQTALRESESRYHALFENAGAAILLIREGIVVEANARSVALLGFGHPDDLIGGTVIRLFPTSKTPGPGLTIASALAAALAGESQHFEHALAGKNGAPFRCEIHLQAVTIGGHPHVQAILWDVTEKRRMEERLKVAQRLEAIGYLAGGVAHDFNNLLTPILGHVDLLLDGRAESDPATEGLRQVQQAALAARRLTRQLLTVGRKTVLETSTIELASYLRSLEPLFRGLIREDIDFRLAMVARDLTVKADSTQLEQVLMNLLINARDAIPKGGRITLSLARQTITASDLAKPGDYAVISVADTGMGIAPDARERLFDPFFTTKQVGKGTGLGLATVLGIVEQHRGHIIVDSEPGQGAAFHVHLPLVSDETMASSDPKTSPRVPGGHELILLVEDDEAVRHFTCRSLEKFGYQVFPAASPALALEVFARLPAPPALVLTDVVMPGMSGKELHDRLVEKMPGLRVLYMSGYSGDTITHHGVLESGVRLLQKPFTLNQLLEKIRDAIDAH